MKLRPQALVLSLLLLIVLLPGCTDMPIIQPPPGEDMPIGEASVVMGPYLTSADAMQPFFRFVTSRRCVAGIQSLDNNRKYVNRQGSFSLFHSLAIPDLQSNQARRYQLWLDDRSGGAYAVMGLPRNGQATTLAFAGASDESGMLGVKGDNIRRLAPNAVVFTTSPFTGGAPEQPAEWESMFFGPLGDKVAMGPLWFAPGANLPKELFPEHAAEGGYWKRDLGAVRIIGIDARAFSFQSSRDAALARLERDLDPAHTKRAWTIVVLSRSAFDARIGDGRILGALGDALEYGGVDLVIGSGDYYMRTRPFSAGGAGQTRYISVADNPTGATGLEPREYVAALANVPHVARLWADEGTLEWQVFDLQGNPIDILTLSSRRPHIEPPIAKLDVLQDAQAALTLQREILKITRQAARAVPEPHRETLISLYFANPTTRVFSGNLTWEVSPGSGWRLDPPAMPFELQPGQGAIARFAVTPGLDSNPPRLVASATDIGSSSERLFVTKEKRYDVYPAPEPIRLDARFRDKTYWRTLPVITGFETVDGRYATSPTEGRITADRNGLIIALSMAAKSVSSDNPTANNPDQHRDEAVLDGESVEIFIDPARRGRDYYHFAVNPRNVVLDESSRAGVAYNPAWRRVVRFGRVGTVETWDVEMRIPWEALDRAGPPAPGEEWGMQIVRRDFAEAREAAQKRARGAPPPPEISQWVQTYGDNTRPGLYGILRFGDISQAPEAADGGRAAPAPGLLFRGGSGQQTPGRLPGSFLPPVPEPPPPDL